MSSDGASEFTELILRCNEFKTALLDVGKNCKRLVEYHAAEMFHKWLEQEQTGHKNDSREYTTTIRNEAKELCETYTIDILFNKLDEKESEEPPPPPDVAEESEEEARKPGSACHCSRNCLSEIEEDRRKEICRLYWEMNRNQRKDAYQDLGLVTIHKPNKGRDKSKLPLTYTLYNQEKKAIPVCRAFFFSTLGYHPIHHSDFLTPVSCEKCSQLGTGCKAKTRSYKLV